MRGINEKGKFLGIETDCQYRTHGGSDYYPKVLCGLNCNVYCKKPRTAHKNCSDAQGYL